MKMDRYPTNGAMHRLMRSSLRMIGVSKHPR